MAARRCSYQATKHRPETWGGKHPENWLLDQVSDLVQWECPHKAADDFDYCVFHLSPDEVPSDIDEGERFREAIVELEDQATNCFIGACFSEITMNEAILDAMEDSPINLSHATVTGPIRFTEAEITQRLIAIQTRFKGNVHFENVTFKDEVNFREACFHMDASFIDTTFQKDATFRSSEFRGDFSSWNSNFNEGVNFWKTRFIEDGEFRRATFDEGARFWDVTFGGSTDFTRVTFKSDSDFKGAEFKGEVDFGDSVFEKSADFDYTTFVGGVDFSDVTFVTDSSFRNVTFQNGVRFFDAAFHGNVDFSKTIFRKRPNLRAAFIGQPSFNESVLINADLRNVHFAGGEFQNADFTDCNLSGANLSDSMLEGAIFSRANLNGTDLEGAAVHGAIFGDAQVDENTDFGEQCVYDPRSGVQLKNNFKIKDRRKRLSRAAGAYRTFEQLASDNGLPQLQSRAFIRRKEMYHLLHKHDTNSRKNWFQRLKSRFRWYQSLGSRLLFRYGESPWRLLGWSVSVIALFSVLYILGGWITWGESTRLTIARVSDRPRLFGISLYYSTLTFTNLGFGKFQPYGIGHLLTILETSLGAVLIALLVYVLGRRATR